MSTQTTPNTQASTHLESNAPITSDLAVVAVEGSGVQATYTSSLRSKAKMVIASILMAATTPMFTSCETDKAVDPIGQVDTKLTAEQQKFADLLAPNKDGTPKSISIDIGDPSSPFYMPKLFRIELKLVNAKFGTYEITPYISKAPIANALAKAEEIKPGKSVHWVNIGTTIKRVDGTEFSPINTIQLSKENDNNPLTLAPFLAQLPEIFTFDEFNKYISSGARSLPKSFTLNKTDELQLYIETETFDFKFEKIMLPIKPVEISAIQNAGN